MTLKSDAKFEEKLTLGSTNDEAFGEFSPNHKSLKVSLRWAIFVQIIYEV